MLDQDLKYLHNISIILFYAERVLWLWSSVLHHFHYFSIEFLIYLDKIYYLDWILKIWSSWHHLTVGMIAWINWEHVTLSGRVTVMVSIVTCGAPILQLPWLVPVPTPTDLQQNNISYSPAWSEVFMVGNIWF